ncbi:HlyD family secretion protein [Vibrio fluvialis]|uniref:HlyD family secretion protein n=1 Tax=Vibrio fluvialis TaxID=676 RepID=UPI00155947B0|nr:HlyD family secretion protein [Vibrio fluvialis]MBY7845076.1 HlyD family secretion protein [Vibrio fluvialis]MBY8029834.1 HlyD family secretion protein [Vibrio fluvialis]MBY8109978.1 HlyD family secretion protein [Vibrio fluvialis]MBY8293072.1 HlyD family secretion protein [Vibrio fluvialis]MBY8310996.1 HlyD family secretion protein [Vibrio fluvialis]
MWSDRVTPITSIARVYSYLVRVAPEVSGNIVEVKIKNNQVVRVGDVMFRVDARNYDLAVRSAQAKLELAGQNIGASTTAVEVAQAKVTDALAARVSELATKGVLSKSELDNAIEARSRAQAALNAAEASLQQAKQNLGPKGNNNPQILAAMVSLEKAQLDLQKTSVTAPSDGIVTNVQLTVGQPANVGTPMLTFIDPREIWISALVRENSLEHIKPGQRVKIVLDSMPGRVLNGKVYSLGWGTGDSNNVDSTTGFIRADTTSINAQRYPVNIVFDEIPHNIRYGSQATVAFYTEQSGLGEFLAGLWMRIVSVWTYVS